MIKVIDLPYDYNALERVIDAQTVEIHYEKHHKTYLTNLLNLIKDKECEGWDLAKLLTSIDKLDASIQNGVKNNAGGVLNHNLYFDILSPNPQTQPSGKLLELINRDFGSFGALKEKLINEGKARFGSGWSFLALNDGKLEVYSLPNQENPVQKGHKALLGIDVWEHAYYLRYQNKRADYLEKFFEILDWKKIEANLN